MVNLKNSFRTLPENYTNQLTMRSNKFFLIHYKRHPCRSGPPKSIIILFSWLCSCSHRVFSLLYSKKYNRNKKTITKLLISAAAVCGSLSLFNHNDKYTKNGIYIKVNLNFVTTSQCEIYYWLASSILFVNRLLNIFYIIGVCFKDFF